jgi:hypothetical protein
VEIDWNTRLERILRQLICRSFPEPRRLRIGIGFDDLEPANCLEYHMLDGRFGIAVSPLLKEAPRKALEGGIAHELAHIVRDRQLGPLQRDWAFERFASSAASRRWNPATGCCRCVVHKTFSTFAAGAIDVLVYDSPALGSGEFAQRGELVLGVLGAGSLGDAGVKSDHHIFHSVA